MGESNKTTSFRGHGRHFAVAGSRRGTSDLKLWPYNRIYCFTLEGVYVWFKRDTLYLGGGQGGIEIPQVKIWTCTYFSGSVVVTI